jgi:hypothetical protein
MKYHLIFLLLLISVSSIAQVYSNKVVGKKNSETIDSLKNSEYPYVLPILGKQAHKAGFSLPYSAGLGINYLWQKSDLVIENLQVGFNHNELRDLSEVIRFNNATSEASGLNFRPDIWVLPFLNVYGIFAKASPSTSVDFGIYAPDSSGTWNNLITLNTKAEFEATTFGFGVTPTIGVGGGWFALDMNFTWNDIAQLSKPAFAFVFGPRLGKTFKLAKPERNIAIWVGGFRLKLNTGTTGDIPLQDLVDTQGLQAKVNNGISGVNQSQQEVDAWWNGLSQVEQMNPVNKAKYQTASSAIETAGNFLEGLDESLNDEHQSSVQYSLDKRPKDMWNFIVGTQFQYSKHWMIRAEYGFLGSRNQLIAGLQYRFGL